MSRRILIGLALAGAILGLRAGLTPRGPNPELIRLAVRATIYAMPTQTPRIVEVTRVVEIVRAPSELPLATLSPTPTFLPTPFPTETPTPQPSATPASLPGDNVSLEVQVASAVESVPQVATQSTCPSNSTNSYTLIPVSGAPAEHPDYLHGDLNLSLRGYTETAARPGLVDISGPTDGDPPQLNTLMPGDLAGAITRAYRVYNWDWTCGEHGCRGGELNGTEVSLLGISSTPGADVRIPARQAQVYAGGYVALVLYAEPTRITLGYTREDSVANGYSVHVEKICVDAALLAAYRTSNASGRAALPGIRNGDVIGVAAGDEIAVAVRDRGGFADPRSRKDWWQSGG